MQVTIRRESGGRGNFLAVSQRHHLRGRMAMVVHSNISVWLAVRRLKNVRFVWTGDASVRCR